MINDIKITFSPISTPKKFTNKLYSFISPALISTFDFKIKYNKKKIMYVEEVFIISFIIPMWFIDNNILINSDNKIIILGILKNLKSK